MTVFKKSRYGYAFTSMDSIKWFINKIKEATMSCNCKNELRTVECPVILFDGGIMPVYKTKKAACADLAVPEKVTIPPHSSAMIGLKVGFEIPDSMKIVMYPRSSLLVKRGLFQPTSIIEPDYNGQEVHAPLFNGTNEEVVLEAGDRVCQIECVPRYDCISWDHEDVERATVNGGFGSTGK